MSVVSGVASAIVLIGIRLVGAAGAGGGLGIDPLAAAGERGLEGPQHPRSTRQRSATPTTPTGSPSTRQPAKELRLFGLAGWTVDRFIARRNRLFELQYRATRLREKSVVWCMIFVIVANGAVFGALGVAATTGGLPLDRLVVFAQVALGVSLIAFGGLNWALDGAAAPVAAVAAARAGHGPARRLCRRASDRRPACPRARSASVTSRSRYPGSDRAVLAGLDLTVPAGTSLAIVGQNGAGKTTLAKLLCRLYDPTAGAIKVDGVDLRDLELAGWRARVAAVFQDFVRFELSLRENVDPAERPATTMIRAASPTRAPLHLADLDTPLLRATRAAPTCPAVSGSGSRLPGRLCAVRRGAGLVLLDEPTAQLDVRGEAEVFDQVLQATRRVTTILISHRFSTVRHADRICVLEHGRVIELGSHHELMAPRWSVSDHVRAASQAFRGNRGRGRSGVRCPLTRCPPEPALTRRPNLDPTTCHQHCPPCGDCAGSATPTSRD